MSKDRVCCECGQILRDFERTYCASCERSKKTEETDSYHYRVMNDRRRI